MYISIKERKGKKDFSKRTYYVYMGISKRIDKQVKNTKEYLFSIGEEKLMSSVWKISVSSIFNFTSTEIESKVHNKLEEVRERLSKETHYKKNSKYYGNDATGSYDTFNADEDEFNKYYQQILDKRKNIYNQELLQEIIKVGFRQMSKKCHPDISKDDGEMQKKLNNTYNYLKDKHGMN